MKADQLATLTSLLSPYVELGNHRLQTLCLLISSLVSARTVNLSHLAAERASKVLVASTYRRLQRFFRDSFILPSGSFLCFEEAWLLV
jgi:hypothetical protein